MINIYLVGGAVRNTLLQLPVKEKDWVVVGATPEELIARGFKPVGKDFPVFIHPVTAEEYALARTERKISRGYKGFEFYAAKTVSLEDDLKRRDLTINAIAMSEAGDIIDPYHGQKDLENKLLRHVSLAFAEDPVRILRVARFYARFYHLGFTIAPETMRLMRQMVQNGEVDALVPERVWQELVKALSEIHPEKFFEALRLCGALQRLMPELDQLYGVPNKPHYHPEIDSGIHTMMVLQQAALLSTDLEIRFAAVCHDFGKGITDMSIWPSHHGHEAAGVPLIKLFCKRFNIPKAYRDLALITAEYHAHCHRAKELQAGTILELFEKTDALRRPERFQQFLLACEADFRGRPGFENNTYLQRDYLLKLLNVVQQTDIKSVLQKQYQGEQLVLAIKQLRILAIKKTFENL